MLKNILQRALRGFVYSVVLALLGAAFSLMRGKPLLEGAYLFVLSGGVLAMVFSIFPLVGTPAMRKAMMQEDPKARQRTGRGGEGIAPAVMGAVMILCGFLLEALTH